MIRLRDFLRVKDCYFSVVGYEHRDGIKCLLRYVPDEKGDRVDSRGRRYRKLSHEEALKYDRFAEFRWGGIFLIPPSKIDEVYRPDERIEDVCKRDRTVAKLRNLFSIRRMGVTGSRLIGLSGENSDVDLVIYGRKNFDRARERLEEGFRDGIFSPPDLMEVYRRRGLSIPYRIFEVHEKRKLNRGRIDNVNFDLLYVRERWEEGFPEIRGRRLGYESIVAEVVESKPFDYPACYVVDHPTIEAVLSFTHTFVGQAFEGEILEARGVLEEVDEKYYLIVGTRRDTGEEYIVSRTLINKFNLEDELRRWKVKTFKRPTEH